MPVPVPKSLRRLNPYRHLSARLALDAAFTVLLLSLVLSGLSGYLSSRQLEQAARQSINELAFQMADKLDRGMFERYLDIQTLAQLDPFRRASVSVEEQRTLLEHLQQNYPHYAWIGMTNTEGVVVASTGSLLEGKQVSERPWFQGAQTEPYVGDVHEAVLLAKLLHSDADKPLRFVDVAVPVVDTQGELIGVLAAHLSWEWAEDIQQSLLAPMSQRREAEIFILDSDGDVLLLPSGISSISPREPHTHTNALFSPRDYITDIVQTHGYRAYPGLGWQVYVRQSRAIALAPARALQWRVLTAGLLLGIATALWYGLRSHRIVNPILRLAAAADAIRRGHHDIHIPSTYRQDEIGILADSLQAMVTTTLQQQTQLLSANRRMYADMQRQQKDAAIIREQAALLNIATDAIIVRDLDWTIRFWNKGAERIYGWSSEEVCGQSVPVLLSQADVSDLEIAKQAVLECGTWRGELRRTTKSREERVVASHWDLVRDANDQPQGILSVETDITERKRSEAAFWESQALYESLVNSLPVNLYRTDLEGRITFVNQIWLQTFGLSANAVIGMSTYDLHPQEWADKQRQSDAQIIAQGQPLYLTEENIDPKTGDIRYVEVIKIPIFDIQGRVEGIQGLFWDVTERQAAEIALNRSKSLWKSLAQNSPDYIMLLNQEHEVVFVNRTIPELGIQEVLGTPLPSLMPESQNRIRKILDQALQTGVPERYETFHDGSDGVRRFFESRVLPIRGSLGDEVLLVTATDITVQKNQQQQLEHIVHYDALTNLPNRTLLATSLQQAMQHAWQHGHYLAVICLDIDGFKTINDVHGHEAGDQLLATLAIHVRQSLRQDDILARSGGDEFVAILADLDNVDASTPILNRMLDMIVQPVQINDVELQISASLGVTFFPQSESIDADQLLRQADLAMYQAKLSGKNRYHIFDTDQEQSLKCYRKTLEEAYYALEHCEFVLHYQPQVNTRTGEIIGAEALIRWQHPQRGLLFPADFLTIVTNSALTIELGEWVFHTALEQLEIWHQAGLLVSISVNVEAYHLQQESFMAFLRQLLAAHPTIPAKYLKLEILETSALDDIAHVSQVMQACQDMGVSFALDDFGTGYSSLTHLKHLPANQLKVDRSFVRDMLDDPSDLAILKGVKGLADAFRREVVAEGVETPEHIRRLLQLGCELAQGYGIARPMPGEDVLEWAKFWTLNLNSDGKS